MPRADSEFAIKTQGLTPLLRSLNKVNKDVSKDLKRGLRDIAKKVRSDARPLAPVRTGALARSITYSATNKGASVRSPLPYAGVHEFGGTISPNGGPITIKASRFLGRAVQKDTAHIEDEIGRLFEDVARRNGFS